MTIRKRRQPTPGFNLPPPYQPITGERAPLVAPGNAPYCAMMQVAAEDTHANYVICRGYDPRIRKFFDYDEEDEHKPGIPVAKPYGNRKVGQYAVGQIFAAFIPLTRIGQTSGVAAESEGHPADLDEEVGILYTDEDTVVTWLMVDGGGGAQLIRFELVEDMTGGECSKAFVREFVNDDPERACGYWVTNTELPILVQDQAGQLCGWSGWEMVDDEWVRPEWADEAEDAIGSYGDCWLPGDVPSSFGDNSDQPIHEIIWMQEPCEMFMCYTGSITEASDEFIDIHPGGMIGQTNYDGPEAMNASRNRVFWQHTPPTQVENIFGWYTGYPMRMICARSTCHDYVPVNVGCPSSYGLS